MIDEPEFTTLRIMSLSPRVYVPKGVASMSPAFVRSRIMNSIIGFLLLEKQCIIIPQIYTSCFSDILPELLPCILQPDIKGLGLFSKKPKDQALLCAGEIVVILSASDIAL